MPLFNPSLADGKALTETVNQVAHPFVVGQGVQVDSGVWTAASDAAETSVAKAVVYATTADTFSVCYQGRVAAVAHGLAVNEYYWLSATGAATAVKPESPADNGKMEQLLFFTPDANSFLVMIQERPIEVGTSGDLAKPWISTTDNMTLVVDSQYVLQAGHTVTFPTGTDGQSIYMVPANGNWALLPFTLVEPGGWTIGSGQSSIAATGDMVTFVAGGTNWLIATGGVALPPSSLTAVAVGGVAFGDGTTLTQDVPNLFFDDTNNRLGVGTNAPASRVTVSGDGFANPNNAGVRMKNTGTSPRDFMIASRSDGALGARLAISDETAGAVRAALGTNGYWGFGTEGPGSKLHLSGDGTADFSNTSIRYTNEGAGGRTWNSGTRGNRFFVSDETAGAERFSIIDNGEIYMNQNAGQQLIAQLPNATLNIQATGGGNHALNLRGNGGSTVLNIQSPTGGNSTLIAFKSDNGSAGAHAGSIAYVGGSGLGNNQVYYNTTSDARLKVDTGRKAKGLDDLMGIRVRNYDWKVGGNADGFFAQELAPIVPSAVVPGTDELNDGGNLKNPWQVDYGKLTPILVQAIQDLNAKVEALTAQLQQATGRAGE